MPDFMDRIQEHQALAAEALNASARLPDAASARERHCAGCGDRIDVRRLAAVPLALRCIGCEELRLKRTRFTGRPRA